MILLSGYALRTFEQILADCNCIIQLWTDYSNLVLYNPHGVNSHSVSSPYMGVQLFKQSPFDPCSYSHLICEQLFEPVIIHVDQRTSKSINGRKIIYIILLYYLLIVLICTTNIMAFPEHNIYKLLSTGVFGKH